MNLCDVNVWLALALSQHTHQAAARQWLNGMAGAGTILFCRATQQSFLRLLTSAAVMRPYGNDALTNDQAWVAYEAFLADHRIDFRADEPAGLEAQRAELARRGTASPKLWMDAYLAAFAISGQYRLITVDSAFRQFPGLDLLVI